MNISFVVGFSRPAVRAYSLNKYILMIARVLHDLIAQILRCIAISYYLESNNVFDIKFFSRNGDLNENSSSSEICKLTMNLVFNRPCPLCRQSVLPSLLLLNSVQKRILKEDLFYSWYSFEFSGKDRIRKNFISVAPVHEF